ncbi:MAG: hypothetical protein AB1755_02240, partial [Candidatus Omnitrophota bacterium]
NVSAKGGPASGGKSQSEKLEELTNQRTDELKNAFSSIINTNNLNGLISKEPVTKEQIFAAYLDSVKQGEYHLTKTNYSEELKANIRRSYVSGGVNVAMPLTDMGTVVTGPGAARVVERTAATHGVAGVTLDVNSAASLGFKLRHRKVNEEIAPRIPAELKLTEGEVAEIERRSTNGADNDRLLREARLKKLLAYKEKTEKEGDPQIFFVEGSLLGSHLRRHAVVVDCYVVLIEGLYEATGQLEHFGLGQMIGMPIIYVDKKLQRGLYTSETDYRLSDARNISAPGKRLVLHAISEILAWHNVRMHNKKEWHEMRAWIKANIGQALILDEQFHRAAPSVDDLFPEDHAEKIKKLLQARENLEFDDDVNFAASANKGVRLDPALMQAIVDRLLDITGTPQFCAKKVLEMEEVRNATGQEIDLLKELLGEIAKSEINIINCDDRGVTGDIRAIIELVQITRRELGPYNYSRSHDDERVLKLAEAALSIENCKEDRPIAYKAIYALSDIAATSSDLNNRLSARDLLFQLINEERQINNPILIGEVISRLYGVARYDSEIKKGALDSLETILNDNHGLSKLVKFQVAKVLMQIGGSNAIKILKTAAESGMNDETRSAAQAVLSDWGFSDARQADELLKAATFYMYPSLRVILEEIMQYTRFSSAEPSQRARWIRQVLVRVENYQEKYNPLITALNEIAATGRAGAAYTALDFSVPGNTFAKSVFDKVLKQDSPNPLDELATKFKKGGGEGNEGGSAPTSGNVAPAGNTPPSGGLNSAEAEETRARRVMASLAHPDWMRNSQGQLAAQYAAVVSNDTVAPQGAVGGIDLSGVEITVFG